MAVELQDTKERGDFVDAIRFFVNQVADGDIGKVMTKFRDAIEADKEQDEQEKEDMLRIFHQWLSVVAKHRTKLCGCNTELEVKRGYDFHQSIYSLFLRCPGCGKSHTFSDREGIA